MGWLHRLNPLNYLFGRIFLWFWLATILLVVSAVWMARQFSGGYEIQPMRGEQMERLYADARHLEQAAERGRANNLSLLLMRAGQRRQIAYLLVEAESRDIVYGFPRHLRPEKDPFIELLAQPTPLAVKTETGTFYGPVDITLEGRAFKLFSGRVRPPGPFMSLKRRHPVILFAGMIAVSMMLCGLLAWSLIRPIREVQSAARRMAGGTLSARVGQSGYRKDELGQLARDFDHMAEQIENLISGQKRLLADISHELRSPLARLQVAIGIAQQNGFTQNMLERIEKEAAQIEQMLARLLALSRLETAADTLPAERCSLLDCLRPIVEDVTFEAQSMHKAVMCTGDQNVYLYIVPQLLASGLENVLRNAVKYAETKVEVLVTPGQSMLEILIEDDGPGVPESELEQIFDPFYRVSVSRDRDSGGVGLGLAIARQSIRACKGRITASRSHLGGLAFKIELPVAAEPDA